MSFPIADGGASRKKRALSLTKAGRQLSDIAKGGLIATGIVAFIGLLTVLICYVDANAGDIVQPNAWAYGLVAILIVFKAFLIGVFLSAVKLVSEYIEHKGFEV
jgi:uncharacterized membrane protein